ncbi:MAG: rod-binding protein [Candidatus Methylomirabilales bacterium]
MRRAAQELEGVFLAHLLKAMRPPAGSSEGGDAGMYRDMFDQEVGLSLARAGGIGLARMILLRESARSEKNDSSGRGTLPILPSTP